MKCFLKIIAFGALVTIASPTRQVAAATIRGMLLQESEPAPNVKVVLRNAQGMEYDPTYTDSSGFYYFDGAKTTEQYKLRIWISTNKSFETPILVAGELTDVPPIRLPRQIIEKDDHGKTEPGDVISNVEAQKFVVRFYTLDDSCQADPVAKCYAESVDYYQDGLRTRDQILKEKQRVYRYFPSRQSKIKKIEPTDDHLPSLKWVRISYDYRQQGKSGKVLRGHSEQIWHLEKHEGNVEIIACQEKVQRQ